MKVTVVNRKGKALLKDLEVKSTDAKVGEINAAITREFPKYTVHRQRLTFGEKNTVLQGSNLLSSYGIKDGDTIIFKDLGPQLGWDTVFYIEYAGPIFIHSLFYFLPTLFYRSPLISHSIPQTIGVGMAIAHFLKREWETAFVHRFSNATMPIRNLPKNCFHYWVLGGVLVAYPLYSPTYSPTFGGVTSITALLPLVGLWLFAQFSNYTTHVILRDLRPPGTTVRKIPVGYGFSLVSCPNYFFEIFGWVIFSIVTGSLTAWFFTIVGAIQMYLWAVKKHIRYKKEFPDYPKSRKVLIPYLL